MPLTHTLRDALFIIVSIVYCSLGHIYARAQSLRHRDDQESRRIQGQRDYQAAMHWRLHA